MSLTISAHFVLGTYQGRSPSGVPEPYPETDRLFSALVAAAGAGPHAEWRNGSLGIPTKHREALLWLELNPPDHLSVPDHRLSAPGATAYRVNGLVSKGTYASPTGKDAASSSSLAGPIRWRWNTAPAHVVASLQDLAPEVTYLGEANSPVLVDVSEDVTEFPNELALVDEKELFPTASVPISTPLSGRLAALEASHAVRLPTVYPQDGKPTATEEERHDFRPGAGLVLRWYRQAEDQTPTVHMPWDGVIVLEAQPADASTTWPPMATDRVAWAVALHRALAKVLSPDAPPLLTGRYQPGAPIPANRLAIQLIGKDDPLGWEMSRGTNAAFALLMPSSASPQDQDAIVRAVQFLTGRTIYIGRAGSVRITRLQFIDGDGFWRTPQPGLERVWIPRPLAVAETRSQLRQSGRPWGLEDAALLAVGMVWRDAFGLQGKGAPFYERLIGAARQQTEVLAPRQLVGQDLSKYVHRANPSTVITAYTALLRFAATVHPRGPLAIGQSRHLGTGLLVPLDVPASLLEQGSGLPWL